MVWVEAKTKKWGHSLGILLDRKAVRKAHLKEDERVKVLVLKENNVLKETFGTMKFRKSVKRMMEEINQELYDD